MSLSHFTSHESNVNEAETYLVQPRMPRHPHNALRLRNPHFPHKLQSFSIEEDNLTAGSILLFLFERSPCQNELLVGAEGHVGLPVMIGQVVKSSERRLELACVPNLKEKDGDSSRQPLKECTILPSDLLSVS